MQSPNEEIGNTILSQLVGDCFFLFCTSLALPPYTLKFYLKKGQCFLPFNLGFFFLDLEVNSIVWMMPSHVGLHVFGLSQDAGSHPLAVLHVAEEEG